MPINRHCLQSLPIVLLCLCALARSAAALEQEEAESLFKRGVEFIKTENYAAALDEFETSYRLHPKLTVLFNIGMCYKALYRYIESIETFERFLATTTEPIPSQMKQEAREAVHVLKRLVGVLHLSELTSGSIVYVDGKRIPESQLPRLFLNPGNHTLEISKDGFETMRTEIQIASDAELTVRAVLSPIKTQWSPTGKQFAFKREEEPGPRARADSNALLPVDQEHKIRRWTPPLITGLTLVVASAGGFVTGGYFVEEKRQDQAAAAKIKEEHDTSTSQQNRTLLTERYQDLEKEVNRDKAGIIVGFAAGAAALAAGVILIVTDVSKSKNKRNKNVTFHPAPGGMTLSF